MQRGGGSDEKAAGKNNDEEEFALYHEEMKERVKEWKVKYGRGEVRCVLIGWLGAEKEYAFTGEQIKTLFDLCF